MTGIVTIDNTQSLLDAQEVMDAAEIAARKLEMVRRKALSTISLVNGLVTQAYSALKGLVSATGGVIDPMFDAMFTMLSSVISTALAAAIMLMSTLHPALIAVGVALMVISLEIQLKAQADLMESKGLTKTIMEMMRRTVQPPETMSPFGVGF